MRVSYVKTVNLIDNRGEESTASIYEALKMIFNEASKLNEHGKREGSLMEKFEKEKRYLRDIWVSLYNEKSNT